MLLQLGPGGPALARPRGLQLQLQLLYAKMLHCQV